MRYMFIFPEENSAVLGYLTYIILTHIGNFSGRSNPPNGMKNVRRNGKWKRNERENLADQHRYGCVRAVKT